MTCETTQQLLLQLALDAKARRQAAESLAHLERCDQCQVAVADFDRLSLVLATTADSSPDEPQAEPDGGWSAFEERLRQAVSQHTKGLADTRPLQVNAQQTAKSSVNAVARSRWHLRHWGMAGAAAAAILIGWFGRGLVQTPGSPPLAESPATKPLEQQTLAAADVVRQLRVFGKIDEVFDGRARWLLLASDTSDVGLHTKSSGAPAELFAPGPQGGGPGRTLLLVRLHLTRSAAVLPQTTTVDAFYSNADVVIVAGSSATINVPVAGEPDLRYRIDTSAENPMHLAVRLEMPQDAASAGGSSILGTILNLQPYRDAAAGRLVTASGTYDLRVAAASSVSMAEGKL